MHEPSVSQRHLAAGLLLTALAVMALEIQLTRIFSVTMWYHFAFLAISVAMFGMSLGSTAIYLHRALAPEGPSLPGRLRTFSLLFAVSIPLSVTAHLYVPFVPMANPLGVISVLATYLIILLPFTLGGVVVAAALTRFPELSGRLYAADLVGAALGCLAVFVFLRIFDGPTAAMASCLPALAAAWAFHGAARRRPVTAVDVVVAPKSLLIVTILATGFIALNALTGAVGVYWMKNSFGGAMPLPMPSHAGPGAAAFPPSPPPGFAFGSPPAPTAGLAPGSPPLPPAQNVLVERWNPMSHLVVLTGLGPIANGWGLSDKWFLKETGVDTRFLLIDNAAGTSLFEGGHPEAMYAFLLDDVTALAYHQLPPEASVAVIGVGGGKDILTAKLAGAASVLGIEINRDILRIINDDFGDFTGHLDRRPGVVFEVDEARSWLARSSQRFDVIQASLIDSWAATAAGAFVLSESGLYTVEGWRLFLRRLTDHGVVSFSRWFLPDQPGEMLRLTAVAVEALRREGVLNPGAHLFIASGTPLPPPMPGLPPLTVGTLIASRSPLTSEQTQGYAAAAKERGFTVILSPTFASRPDFLALINQQESAALMARYPLDISPSTDDRPFFFNMLHPLRAFDTGIQTQLLTNFNVQAVRMVLYLLLALSLLTLVCIVLPLALAVRPGEEKPLLTGMALLYFAGIGLGFMLVELGQVHRLTLYLGHPTYGLVVVLMGMLLSAGAGSLASERLMHLFDRRGGRVFVAATFLSVLTLTVLATPAILRACESASLAPRLALSFLLVAAPGFFMGMPFPAGLRLASAELGDRLPWLWGVNGAFSVVGSIIAVLLSIGWGISFAMLAGVGCYVLCAGFLAVIPSRS